MQSGYREIQHTADWQLEVWAPDFPALLAEAARGMFALEGVQLAAGPRQVQTFTLTAWDAESLLVKFLGELLYWQQQHGLGFDQFHLQIDGITLVAQLEGAAVVGLDKQIKAVTYHNLVIQPTPRGLEVRIVFDV
jgi:SHS2 domain-containing protein